MGNIKSYETVHRAQPELAFRIFRMADVHAETGGATDAPHRHGFYTVLVVADAEGSHVIDYHAHPFEPGQLFFVSPGQVHQVVETRPSSGYVLLFSAEFLVTNGIESCFVDNLRLFNDYGDSPPIALSDAQLSKLQGHAEQMIQISTSDMQYRDQAVGALLKLFLIEAANSAPSAGSSGQLAGNIGDFVRRFRNAVEQHYAEWHGAAPYAKLLGISVDHLNRTLKQLIGRTAKEYIQSRLVVEAKRLLAFSELSLKEVGFTLGFSEAGNFSVFFKSRTDMTPSMFREQQKVGKP